MGTSKPNLGHACRAAAEALCKTKTDLCRKHNGQKNLAPMVHYFLRRHEEGRVKLLVGPHSAIALAEVLEEIREEGSPELVLVLMDCSYSTAVGQTYRRGQLAEDFMHNARSSVKECLAVTGIEARTKRLQSLFINYKYDESGLPEFEEVSSGRTTGDSQLGGIPEILAEYISSGPGR